MLISFQFSIIDFRDLFEDEKRNKLPIDSYIDNNGMIRNFGSVCEKAPEKKNVVTSNGKKYFSANNVIRFCDFLFKNFKLAEGAQCISRRYYNDGTAVGRFEISLTSTTKNELSIKDIKSIISKYANLKVKIKTINLREKEKKSESSLAQKSYPICSALKKESSDTKLKEKLVYTGKDPICKEKCEYGSLIQKSYSIASAYYYSTLNLKKENANTKLEEKLVQAGKNPICIVQLDEGCKITDNDAKIVPMNNNGEFNLYYFYLRDLKLKVYILEPVLNNSIENISKFRYAISRVNAEKEKISCLYNFLQKDKELYVKEKILDCISKTQKNLSKNERFGININEISNLAFNIEDNEIDNDSIQKAVDISKKIGKKFSIGQAQLLFNTIDYNQLIEKIEQKLEEYSENQNKQKRDDLDEIEKGIEEEIANLSRLSFNRYRLRKILEKLEYSHGIIIAV